MTNMGYLLALFALSLTLTTVVAKIPKVYHGASVVRGQEKHLKKDMTVVDVTCAAKKTVPKATLNVIDLMLCGAFATVIGDFAMHPVDTIKVYQQASASKIGIVAAAKAILKAGGISGLYQGVVPYLVADGTSGAVKFATFELSNKFIEKRTPATWHTWTRFACAAFAMLACSVVLIPGEVLKTRLQAGTSNSLGKIMKDIMAQDGFRGFFAGYAATILRDVPYTMLELGIYENLKLIVKNKSARKEISQREELFCAAFTGILIVLLIVCIMYYAILKEILCVFYVLFRWNHGVFHYSSRSCENQDDDAINVYSRAIQECV
jgi:hypothetical protein